MSRRVFPLTLGSLFLAVSWGCADDPTGPTIEPFCASQSRLAIVTFDDQLALPSSVVTRMISTKLLRLMCCRSQRIPPFPRLAHIHA